MAWTAANNSKQLTKEAYWTKE